MAGLLGPQVGQSRRGQRRLASVVFVWATLIVGLTQSAPALAAADFQITISPPSQTLPPGQSVGFAVGIGAIDGFSDPVSLSVGPLPEGVTGTFSVNPLTPSGTSILTLTAADTVPTGTYSVPVRGTAGGITHETSGLVKVDFGLVPVCYGAAEGVVTDADTHLPLAGVEIQYGNVNTTTDARGQYRVEQLGLGENNSAQEFQFDAFKPDYWDGMPSAIAVCDQTTRLDFAMVPVHPARASGRVVVGNPDPSDYSVVIPTSTPIEGALVGIDDAGDQTHPAWGFDPPTGPDGSYDFTFRLGNKFDPNHLTFDPYLHAFVPDDPTSSTPWRQGYWERRYVPMGHVEPGQHVVQDIGLVKKCTVSISGRVIYGATGLPASGVRVNSANLETDSDQVTTDGAGAFSFPALLLGQNNAPTKYYVSASPEGYEGSAEAPLGRCGDHQDVTVVLGLVPTYRYGVLEGSVHDEETGAPVEGVFVDLFGITCPCDTTDANGHYRLVQIPVGITDDAVTQVTIVGSHDDYWEASAGPIEIRANQTSTAGLRVLRKRFGGVGGVVRDAITKNPIMDADVTVDYPARNFKEDFTDAEGRYAIDHVSLGYRNEARGASVQASAGGYWPKTVTAEISADKTTPQDFELLPVCQGAMIIGKVVDAATQQPIAAASVSGGGALAITDINGDYRLEHVGVGTDNSPLQVDVSASAFGYYGQTKSVTVFCGAVIVLDFGREPPKAAIDGYVTNETTGLPIANTFIGSEFGAAATTDEHGYYKLTDVPLNPDGSPRTWNITASPGRPFDDQTKPVTVRANETARLDFAFRETAPPTGTLEVIKKLAPTTDPGKFDLQVDGQTKKADAQNDGSTGPVTVDTGTNHSVSESAGTSTSLSNYTAAITCQRNGAAAESGQGTSLAGITVGKDDRVVCTITNTRNMGTLEVIKKLDPTTDLGKFDLQIDAQTKKADATNNGTTGAAAVNTGTNHSVSETAGTGTTLGDYTASISCTRDGDASESGSGTSLSGITVGNDDRVVCTITNTRRNHSPECSSVGANPSILWPPNHMYRLITLSGATDPDGDPVTLVITGVTQDEPLNGLGDGDTSPDAKRGPSSHQVYVRAERSGLRDGRVYRIAFTGSDGKGGTCSGTALVGAAPHDQGQGSTPVDSAPPSYDSFGP